MQDQQTDEVDTWLLSDDDFRAYIDTLDGFHIWTDHPGVDPAMQALVVERQLRRAANKLLALDKLYPGEHLAVGAQRLRFVADLLSDGAQDVAYASIWLEAGRNLIHMCGERDD
jgi:hypothetical protein